MLSVGIRLSFDSAHRLKDYSGKCWHLHGHRYVLECQLSATNGLKQSGPCRGMIVDFGVAKEQIKSVLDKFDHGVILEEKDDGVVVDPGMRVIRMATQPTVEAIILLLASDITEALRASNIVLRSMRLYETENCWADWAP